ncbi:flavin reductase family protein [Marinactinospora thermotolerans]|nr:flavin reductase [Marinactinospora thermotolerans]
MRNGTSAPIAPATPDFATVKPSVLYFGSLVSLLSTLNPDGGANLAPNSSMWALGHTLVIGLGEGGQTLENLRRGGELVVNLPEADQWPSVERLAPLTGALPVPPEKAGVYRHERDKFGAAGLTALASERVAPPRVAEYPVHLEAVARQIAPAAAGGFAMVEAEVLHVHVRPDLSVPGSDHVDVGAWHPLFYVFRHFIAAGTDLGRDFRAER